jgi:hypothetical protein
VSELLVLGCSATKRGEPEPYPAFVRYDGPWYRDFRKHLRDRGWPISLDVAILSAQHGLIGALSPITAYDRKMTPARAAELAPSIVPTLDAWDKAYDNISLCLGADYLHAFPAGFVDNRARRFEGPIGLKRQQLGSYLRGLEGSAPRLQRPIVENRLSYFLPDWDDLLDPDFDFRRDEFSGSKGDRQERHCSLLMRPDRIADGILVSLAQTRSAKGPLKYVGGIDARTLRPLNLRAHYGLDDDQVLFGDCGAFSYVHDDQPPITTDYAATLYDLYGFDLGASIDHIPVMERVVGGRSVRLTEKERRERVRLTVENAAAFIMASKKRNACYEPVGTIQGLEPKDYARNAVLYAELGYRRIALGGLVPLPDDVIREIVHQTTAALRNIPEPPKIHLFGVFRPKLQDQFRELGIASFDSATYFRKAWLRSGQNYLAASGQWYAAIRVPMTSDGRTRVQLLQSGKTLEELQLLESAALSALHGFGDGIVSLPEALDAIEAYDRCYVRSSEDMSTLRHQYARTLGDRPWEKCTCSVCRTIGIDVLIFRGSNRNKRRGAHNTSMLFNSVCTQRHQ